MRDDYEQHRSIDEYGHPFPMGLPLIIMDTHRFVERVLSSTEPGFDVSDSEQEQQPYKKPGLSSFFSEMFLNRQRAYPDYFQPSETVRLFLAIVDTFEPLLAGLRKRNLSLEELHAEQISLYNSLIQEIRKQGVEQEFKRAVLHRAQVANGNFDSATLYVNQLFEMYEKLHVVRVECGVLANEVYILSEDDALMAKYAKECLNNLNNNKRNNRLFADMAGYLWKLEYHPRRGYYFHFIFFFANVSVELSKQLTDRIGQYWVDRITNGRGKYWDCKSLKGKFLSSCIGVVEGNDQHLRDKLRQALFYLTQKDIYLKFGVHCEGKRFRHGEV
ncbi:hypothetical protein ACO0LB_06410 [Undibacterium sp. SXout7W]|uniref:hypothetical protein n=1 Tax=Undibacterium sp. SXout7W TaxID=3413049 RepID=UPI003BF1580D